MTTEADPRTIAGRYELGPVIGRGGMGEVRRGFDRRLGRAVAVKSLRPELAAQDAVRVRFEREARAAAGLTHPNAVTVFDSGEDEGSPYIVMELLPGRTLADEIATGPLPVARVRTVAVEVLGALGAAHHLGILHRDVKPSNLLRAADGTYKVGDFGIAKSAGAGDETSTGEILGTVAYLAPERLNGQPATASSDLYALGVVLYEALAGVKPFLGATPAAVLHAVQTGDVRPLSLVRPEADTALTAAIARAMAVDPSGRFRSAAEMAEAIAVTPSSTDQTVAVPTLAPSDDATRRIDVPEPTTVVAAQPPPPVESGPRPVGASRARPGLIALALIGVIVVIGLVALALGGSSGTPARAPVTTAPAAAPAAGGAGGAGSPALPAPLDGALNKLQQAVTP